jgi:hypothetical protein
MLVLDSRGPQRDALDSRFIAQSLQEHDRDDLQYAHRGRRDEPLLCLPDAVAWAVGAGGLWRQLIDPVVGDVIETGP